MAAACACCTGNALAGEGVHWGYTGSTGPGEWDKLNSASQACSIGHRQSPIDIVNVEKGALPKLQVKWLPSKGYLLNNGHAIQIGLDNGGSLILDEDEYEFVQAHFHSPSEHWINGQLFPMEAHFVHRNRKSQALAVAVLIAGGGAHEAFGSFASVLPNTADQRHILQGEVSLTSLLPTRLSYWSYSGSLTTPPCSEQVRWIICKEPIHVNDTDIELFRALYPMNARPIQRNHGRVVYESD